jgi:hypothetical protein
MTKYIDYDKNDIPTTYELINVGKEAVFCIENFCNENLPEELHHKCCIIYDIESITVYDYEDTIERYQGWTIFITNEHEIYLYEFCSAWYLEVFYDEEYTKFTTLEEFKSSDFWKRKKLDNIKDIPEIIFFYMHTNSSSFSLKQNPDWKP